LCDRNNAMEADISVWFCKIISISTFSDKIYYNVMKIIPQDCELTTMFPAFREEHITI
jgi:hypothetical protein